jgi:putative spermidine/putrescine transport system substrate-binding protein
MAAEFFTSPSNTTAQISAALAADVPVNGPAMASIVQFDWSKINPMVGEITDRWNREMK